MRMTLLEIVQAILNEMDGDEVTTISGTVESSQVAYIVRDAYSEMMSNRNWPHMMKLFQCTEQSDTASAPAVLTIPTEIKELRWLKYNKRSATDTKDKYVALDYRLPEEFYDICSGRTSSATNVTAVLINNITLNIRTDHAPTYWTSFDDSLIVCDSYDSAVEAQLKTARNACYGVRNPSWTHTDGAYPELPIEAFPSLLEEAKATAFYTLRETINQKAEQKSQRQSRWLSRKAWRAAGGIQYPNFGRKKSRGSSNSLFDKG